jgi:hypothetical protein
MYDALRLDISNTSAAHEVTGLNDYNCVSSATEVQANDAVTNQ